MPLNILIQCAKLVYQFMPAPTCYSSHMWMHTLHTPRSRKVKPKCGQKPRRIERKRERDPSKFQDVFMDVSSTSNWTLIKQPCLSATMNHCWLSQYPWISSHVHKSGWASVHVSVEGSLCDKVFCLIKVITLGLSHCLRRRRKVGGSKARAVQRKSSWWPFQSRVFFFSLPWWVIVIIIVYWKTQISLRSSSLSPIACVAWLETFHLATWLLIHVNRLVFYWLEEQLEQPVALRALIMPA